MLIQPLETVNDKTIREAAEVIEKAREEVLSSVHPEKDNRLAKGFLYRDKYIQSDEESKGNLQGYLTMLSYITFPMIWRTYDNTDLEIVDGDELSTMSLLMMGFIETTYKSWWAIKDNIKAATTVDEITILTNNYLDEV